MDEQRPQPRQVIPTDATTAYRGAFFSVVQWQQPLFDGTTATFEAIRRPDSVNVIVITPSGKIMLTHQEQPGMKPFYSALGGKVDAGETAREAGERELHEEAGLEATTLEFWHVTQPADKCDWVCWTYIAKGCTKIADAHPDAGERIELVEVTFEEYLHIITRPEYRDRDIAFELLRLQARGEIENVRKQWLSEDLSSRSPI